MSSMRAEPNLTPILDMVFQLITFFMLVINFRATDFNKEVELPVVGASAPADEELQGDMLVLNITNDGTVIARGKPQLSLKNFLVNELKGFEITSKKSEADELNSVTVVVRADRDLTYRVLNSVMETCKSVGFSKFVFVVMRKANQAGPQ
ncbi:MAG: biopolymer transporter ExbD [Pirellulaceae bacterium]|nr:biopolymer transporter ExbD [Pirellulaceae bacterium]